MKKRDRFTFLGSYYEMFKHLKTKKDQSLYINSILSAQFSLTKLEVLPEFSPSLQMALEAVSYQVNSSIDGYIKANSDLPPRGMGRVTPPLTPRKEEIEIEIEIEREGEENPPPPSFFNFNHYMDVLDYLKDNGESNKLIVVDFENIKVKVSTHGKAYNATTTYDLDRKQETRFLTYLMNNTKLLKG